MAMPSFVTISPNFIASVWLPILVVECGLTLNNVGLNLVSVANPFHFLECGLTLNNVGLNLVSVANPFHFLATISMCQWWCDWLGLIEGVVACVMLLKWDIGFSFYYRYPLFCYAVGFYLLLLFV